MTPQERDAYIVDQQKRFATRTLVTFKPEEIQHSSIVRTAHDYCKTRGLVARRIDWNGNLNVWEVTTEKAL